MRKDNWFKTANDNIRGAEASVVNFLSAIAPWGAPLIPATMVFYNLRGLLQFEPWIAFIAAAVVEILGLATVSTAMTFWQSNRKQRANYKKMPVIVPVVCFAWYLLVTITVNVLLEAPWQPQVLIYIKLIARALLTTLSIPAAVTLSIRAIHSDAIYAIATQPERQPEQQQGNSTQLPELQGNRKAILDELQVTPHATSTQLGMKLGITRQAVDKHVAWLRQNGYVTSNGKH